MEEQNQNLSPQIIGRFPLALLASDFKPILNFFFEQEKEMKKNGSHPFYIKIGKQKEREKKVMGWFSGS